jgi:hypothetical protein
MAFTSASVKMPPPLNAASSGYASNYGYGGFE